MFLDGDRPYYKRFNLHIWVFKEVANR